MDSDFSIDENDEPVSDNEEEGKEKKKRRLVTKAYREPIPEKKQTKPRQKVVRTSLPKVKSPNSSQQYNEQIGK